MVSTLAPSSALTHGSHPTWECHTPHCCPTCGGSTGVGRPGSLQPGRGCQTARPGVGRLPRRRFRPRQRMVPEDAIARCMNTLLRIADAGDFNGLVAAESAIDEFLIQLPDDADLKDRCLFELLIRVLDLDAPKNSSSFAILQDIASYIGLRRLRL